MQWQNSKFLGQLFFTHWHSSLKSNNPLVWTVHLHYFLSLGTILVYPALSARPSSFTSPYFSFPVWNRGVRQLLARLLSSSCTGQFSPGKHVCAQFLAFSRLCDSCAPVPSLCVQFLTNLWIYHALGCFISANQSHRWFTLVVPRIFNSKKLDLKKKKKKVTPPPRSTFASRTLNHHLPSLKCNPPLSLSLA